MRNKICHSSFQSNKVNVKGIKIKNSLSAIYRSSVATGGVRLNCQEFFGSFCRYKKNEEKGTNPLNYKPGSVEYTLPKINNLFCIFAAIIILRMWLW